MTSSRSGWGNSEIFRKMVGFGLVFLLAWTPQAGRATRQCPHDATSGGKEATEYRCRLQGESESSGGSSYNPWHNRFWTPKLVAMHGERSRRKPFRNFWPNHHDWGPDQRQTASPNALKTRTRRRRAPRRVWRDFRDLTSPRPPGMRRRS